MAVADLGVAIGPRSRRRLTVGAIVVAAIAVISAAALLLLRPPTGSGPASSLGSTRPAPPRFVTEIVYGMSKAEVRRRIGEPTKAVGACWQYDENELIRNGQNMLDAQRVCFLGGVYSYDYSRIDGKWFYPTTPLKVGR